MCCNFPGELSSSCELTRSTLMVEISLVMRVQQFLVVLRKFNFNSDQLAYCVFYNCIDNYIQEGLLSVTS